MFFVAMEFAIGGGPTTYTCSLLLPFAWPLILTVMTREEGDLAASTGSPTANKAAQRSAPAGPTRVKRKVNISRHASPCRAEVVRV